MDSVHPTDTVHFVRILETLIPQNPKKRKLISNMELIKINSIINKNFTTVQNPKTPF